MSQPGLFDQQEILSRRDKKGDVLVRLNNAVEWKVFEPIIKKALSKDRRSQAGRKSYNPLLMFKVLILQSLYNMSDDAAEDIIDDRLTFRRFVGLEDSQKSPDATTIWRFREALVEAGVMKELFEIFNRHLEEQGSNQRKTKLLRKAIRLTGPKRKNGKRMWMPAGRKRTEHLTLDTKTIFL